MHVLISAFATYKFYKVISKQQEDITNYYVSQCFLMFVSNGDTFSA